MNLHEYQGKAVLKTFGVAVSAGAPAFTVDEAIAAAKSLPGPVYVVKSQIHAGGRGKGKASGKSTSSAAKAGLHSTTQSQKLSFGPLASSSVGLAMLRLAGVINR